MFTIVAYMCMATWPAVIVSAICLAFLLMNICMIAVKDYEFDEEDFRRRLEEMVDRDPSLLEILNESLVEPLDYSSPPSALEELLSRPDAGSHRRLMPTRSEDRQVIKTCSNESLYSMSFADIASMYGTTEEELILFLNTRCPEVLYRRVYFTIDKERYFRQTAL